MKRIVCRGRSGRCLVKELGPRAEFASFLATLSEIDSEKFRLWSYSGGVRTAGKYPRR